MNDSPEMRAREAASDLRMTLGAKGITLSDDARTAINQAFLSFAQSPEQQGEGMVLVPREPTYAMQKAGDDQAPFFLGVRRVWDAMIASAPPIPDVQDGGGGTCLICGGSNEMPVLRDDGVNDYVPCPHIKTAIPERGEVAIPDEAIRKAHARSVEVVEHLRPAASRPDVVERAAMALHEYEESWNDHTWDQLSDRMRELFRGQARAALAALCPDTTAASEQDHGAGKPEHAGGGDG